MSDWTVHLEFVDEKSSKFWRARTDGNEFIVNYGRIGSDGQTKVKDMGSAEAATAEMEKVAAQKRKKGYGEAGGEAGDSEETEAVSDAPESVTLSLQRDGHEVSLTLTRDGAKLETVVTETHADAGAAAATFARVTDALAREGYQAS